MENYPQWYEYYDLQMGTSKLLLLPDIRGEKEEYYISACLKEEHKKNSIQSDNTFIKPKPGLYGDPKVFNEFINLFEDKYFKYTSEGYINATKDHYDEYEINDDDIDNAIRILQKADERVSMPSSSNWREAVIKCAILYKNGKIASEIDIAYEEYLMLRSAGIGWYLDDYSGEYRKERLVKFYEDLILDGREALGEQRDFNF